MVLFILFAAVYGAFQLFTLSFLSRTIRWRTILVAVIAGASACALAALAIEAGWGELFASLSGRSLSATRLLDAYTTDPFVEEICKTLPLLLVLLVARVRRQLGVADTVLIAAALGCGFGFVENVLRYSHNPAAATWVADGGYWQIRNGASLVSVPGIGAALGSWLPSGAAVHSLFARSGQINATNVHLAWSALLGLSVGVVLRGRGRWKWAALVPFLIACLSHVGNNAAVEGVSFAGPLAAMASQAALFALLAIVVATWVDHQIIAGALRDEGSIRLAGEDGGPSAAIGLLSERKSNPWSLVPLWSFILQRRSFALAKAAMPADERLPAMRARLASLRTILELNEPVAAPAFLRRPVQATTQSAVMRPPWHRRLTPRNVLVLLVGLPPLLYFVVGNFAPTAELQTLMANAIVFPVVMLVLVLGMILRGATLARGTLALPDVLRRAPEETVIGTVFSLLTTLGGLGVGAISAVRFLNGNGALQPALSFAHLLDAIGKGPLIALAMLALLVLVAPEILAGIAALAELAELGAAGEGMFAFWTGGEAAAAAASEAGVALGDTALGQAAAEASESMLADGVPWDVVREVVWEPASEAFAESASGTPTAFVNNLAPTSVWSQVEFQTLMNNPNVAQIAVQYMDGAAALTEDLWFEMGEQWATSGQFFP